MMVGTLVIVLLQARTVTLDDAVRAAETNQPQLRVARANSAAGEARAEQAFAPMLPEVKLVGSYLRTTGNRVLRPGRTTPVVNSSTMFNRFDFSLTGGLILWDFGQSHNRWRAAEARADALTENEQLTRLQIVSSARTSFFRARAQEALARVAREGLTNQERHLGQISGFVQAGTRPEIDLVQARADHANARVQLINAEDGYALARAQLNQAMGMTGSIDYDVADETFAPVPGEDQSADALVNEALRARPEIAALELQIRAQDLSGRAARGAYWPTLAATAGATDAGTELQQHPDFLGQPSGGLAWNLFAGLTLTWPLFQGMLTRAQVRESDAALTALRAQHDGLVQQVWMNVQQATLSLHAAKEVLTASGEALVNAQQRLLLAEGRYTAGVGNAIELGDAQLGAVSAGAQRVIAEYNLAATRAELLLALGRR